MTLRAKDLAYWDIAKHAWVVEKEPVRLLAGGSSDRLPLTAEIQIDAPYEFKPGTEDR
jgi:beta-glucosidase